MNPTPKKRTLLVEFPKYMYVQFCTEWLSMVDLCNLDSAMCSKTLRPNFLEVLRFESAVFNGVIAPSQGINEDFIQEPAISPTDDSLLVGMDQTPSYLTRYGRTTHNQAPKTLATKRKFERKVKRESMLEQQRNTCYYRQPYQNNDELILPNSIYCLPNCKIGAHYMRWLSLRQIVVRHLIVTLDFSDHASAHYFSSYFLSNDKPLDAKTSNKYLEDVDPYSYMSPNRNHGYGSETDDNYVTKGRRLDSMWDDDLYNSAVTPIFALSFDSVDCHMDTTVTYDDSSRQVENAQVNEPYEQMNVINKEIEAATKRSNKISKSNRLYRKLKSLCFRNCIALSDEDLIVVNPCLYLENLELVNCTKVSDLGVMDLTEGWKYLKSLNLRDSNRLSDDAVCAVAMSCPRLQFLDFHSCNKITDIGLHQVALSCKELRYLYLSFGFSVTDEGFTSIINSCDKLETLSLELCNKLTDDGLMILAAKVYPAMSNLNLLGCTRLSDESLSLIGTAFPNLTSLLMGLCVKLTDDAVNSIVMKCAQLQHISLSYCTRISDNALLKIASHCPKLKSLEVSMCKKVTNVGLRSILRNCKELESLNLEGCKEVNDSFLMGSFPENKTLHSLTGLTSTTNEDFTVHAGGFTETNNSSNNSAVDNASHLHGVEMEQYNSNQDLENVPTDLPGSPDFVGFLESSLESGFGNEVTRINSSAIAAVANDSSTFNYDSSMIDQSSFVPNDESLLRLQSDVTSLFQASSADYQPFYSPTQSPTYLEHTIQSSSNVSHCKRKEVPLLKNLKNLNISECPAITDCAIAFLAGHSPHLRVLNVRQCSLISRDGIINIKRNCHDVRILHSL